MTDSIKPVNATEVKKTCAENQPAKAQQEKPSKSVSAWEEAKVYAKGAYEGFTGYYAEKFEGTEGVSDALKRTGEILAEGNQIMEEKSHWNDVKAPIKNKILEYSAKVDKMVDDGDNKNLSFAEKAWDVVKGGGEIVDSLTTPLGVSVTMATAGLATEGMAALSTATPVVQAAVGTTINSAMTLGGGTLAVKGGYDVATAETHEQAKKGGAELISGGMLLYGAASSAKQTLNVAKSAGFDVPHPATISTPRAMVENIKIAPKAIAAAAKDVAPSAKASLFGMVGITPKETVIKAGSKELSDAVPYMSKANDVQAYRFNPNGTPEEVLANNPGVFRNANGQYCIPNKWNPEQPYIIDPSKQQMIMLYGGDDMAVCEGSVFQGSYVDTASFKANGALNYQNPAQLQYGKVVNVTKQAPGAFKEVPVGTKVQTIEGIRTVGKGDVVAVDHAGNPYVTPLKNIAKRNIPIDTQASKAAFNNIQHTLDNGFKIKPGMEADFDAVITEMAADTEPLGWSNGLPAMKKIMAGLEDLTTSGNMTSAGYSQMAASISDELPGWYWSKAINMYNQFGANAMPTKTIAAVQDYLSGVTTVNGCSNLYRAKALPSTGKLLAATISAATPVSTADIEQNDNDSVKNHGPRYAN